MLTRGVRGVGHCGHFMSYHTGTHASSCSTHDTAPIDKRAYAAVSTLNPQVFDSNVIWPDGARKPLFSQPPTGNTTRTYLCYEYSYAKSVGPYRRPRPRGRRPPVSQSSDTSHSISWQSLYCRPEITTTLLVRYPYRTKQVCVCLHSKCSQDRRPFGPRTTSCTKYNRVYQFSSTDTRRYDRPSINKKLPAANPNVSPCYKKK